MEKKNIDVLVGCQYGSEGKGLVAAEIASRNKYDWVVSVNSAQAGHTAYVDGKKIVTRHLPSACLTSPESLIFIGPGSIINPEVLIEEIDRVEAAGVPIRHRLYIAETATIVCGEDITNEARDKLTDRLGSTGEGISSALKRKVTRELGATIRSHDVGRLQDGRYFSLCPSDLLKDEEGDIFIEGSQGHGLSIFEDCYPYCTSRDTSTAAFLSYARLSPRQLRDVYGVYRTFPIRVGGNSGPMFSELEWEMVEKISGYENLAEYTTVTKRKRRIGDWDPTLARFATTINGVNRPVLTFANYLSKEVEGVTDSKLWSDRVRGIIDTYASHIGVPWWAISTSRHGDFEYNYNKE